MLETNLEGMKLTRIISALLTVSFSISIFAADWAQWRGPEFNGSSPETGLPSAWEKDQAKWSVDMPGPSASTPIIKGDKVFISTPDAETQTLHAMALDRKSGEILWKKEVGVGMRRDDRSNYTSPSPVALDDKVFFFYGNGTLIAFDHSGKELWKRDIQEDYGDFAFQWTFSSSPMFYEGTLYLQVLQRDVPVHGKGKRGGESFLLGIDPDTGKTKWRHVRPSEARAESLEAFSTPIPHEYQGRKEILVVGGDLISGHDPKDGRELWRWGTWNPTRITHWRLVPSPVAGEGIILACAPKKDPIYAVKAGLSGTLTDEALAWVSREERALSSDVPTPLFYKNDFFILNDDRGALSRVEPKTGKIKWSLELPGRKKYEASPTGADGKIYLMNFGGDVVVVDAEKGEVLSNIPMGTFNDNMTRSTVAVAHGNLFIRTNEKLFCIGK